MSLEPPPVPKWTRLPVRARPHRNPLADNLDPHPDHPEAMREYLKLRPARTDVAEATSGDRGQSPPRDVAWASGYPLAPAGAEVTFCDVGCAFGGMLCVLAPMFPDVLMLGLEIRTKVVEFARGRVLRLRHAAATGEPLTSETDKVPGSENHHFNNCWFEPLNLMKHGANCFRKGQLERMFFCYPDPHFKRKNVRRRIISPALCAEYAFWLRPGGLLYTVSDVPELEEWMVACLDACPMFVRLTEAELDALSPFERRVLTVVTTTSEDAQRTARKGLKPNFAIHRRVVPDSTAHRVVGASSRLVEGQPIAASS